MVTTPVFQDFSFEKISVSVNDSMLILIDFYDNGNFIFPISLVGLELFYYTLSKESTLLI